MSEMKLVTELAKPTGFVFRVFEDEDGTQRREMEDAAGRKLEWVAGIFFDRRNHCCYRGDNGDLCQITGANRHVWEFEDARLNVDYKDKDGNPVKAQQLLDPTGFLTKASCAYLASWLETNFPEYDFFIAPGQFMQTGSFQRYPQNQLYIVIVRKTDGGISIKQECAGLIVSNTFLRYDEEYAKRYCEQMLTGAWDVRLENIDPDALKSEPALPLPVSSGQVSNADTPGTEAETADEPVAATANGGKKKKKP